MASYVIMQPPAKSSHDPVFVRDGFAWLGFVIPPLWLAWHRLWLEAALALGLMLAVPAAAAVLGISPLASWLSGMVSIFVGLEGPALRLAALRRRGFTDGAVFEADRLDDAETRFAAESNWGPWSPGAA